MINALNVLLSLDGLRGLDGAQKRLDQFGQVAVPIRTLDHRPDHDVDKPRDLLIIDEVSQHGKDQGHKVLADEEVAELVVIEQGGVEDEQYMLQYHRAVGLKQQPQQLIDQFLTGLL